MKYKNLIVLMLVFSLLFSINAVSAEETNLTCENYAEHNILDQADNVVDDDLLSDDSFNREVSSEDEYIIYVGQNITEDGGNGSYENPFSSLNLACANVSGGKNKVTLNIFEGTYLLDSHLKFNTSNLKIQGIGKAVIKSIEMDEDWIDWNTIYSNPIVTAISLTGPLVNFTYSNLIFNESGWNSFNDPETTCFYPFYQYESEVDIGIFNNCTFTEYDYWSYMFHNPKNIKFSQCKFCAIEQLVSSLDNVQFEYCTLLFENICMQIGANNLLDSVWFGQNKVRYNMIPITRYAVFSVCENYIGDDTYEIVGKLMWNDSTTDGIGNLGDMVVKLSSTTGNIPETAILKNGTFKVIYTTPFTEHKITAKLDDEIITISKNNIMLNPSSSYYGEDAKIEGNFSQIINGTAKIVVYNDKYSKTFNLTVNSSSFAYVIPDILKEGIYKVNVTLNGLNVYGFNFTNLTVSKFSDYVFETIIPSGVVVGESATIIIELPDDVNGTVTIKFGNEIIVLPANTTMNVIVSNLNATTCPLNISYSGSDKYAYREKIDNINVEPAESLLNIEDNEFIYSQNIVIPFTTINATGISVRVLKNGVEIAKTTSNKSKLLINKLDVGKYILEVTTIVNSNYKNTSKNINLTINKASSAINVKSELICFANDYYAGERGVMFYAILHDNNNNPIINKNVQITINGITYNMNTDNNGKAGIQINLASAKTYTCKITFAGDNNHIASNTTYSKIILKKKTTSIKAKNQIFKAKIKNKKITVNLKTIKNQYDGKNYLKTGKKITLTIKGKKYTAKINKKGKATFKIKLNKKGQYTAKIQFKGDKTYKESNKTIKIKIK